MMILLHVHDGTRGRGQRRRAYGFDALLHPARRTPPERTNQKEIRAYLGFVSESGTLLLNTWKVTGTRNSALGAAVGTFHRLIAGKLAARSKADTLGAVIRARGLNCRVKAIGG